MKVFLSLAIALACVLGNSAAWAGQQDFTVINGTGATVERLFVSSSSTTDWEEDVLGDGTIPPGGQLNVHFPDNAPGKLFDLMAVNPEGGQMMFQQLNLLEISTVTLTIQNGEPVAVIQ